MTCRRLFGLAATVLLAAAGVARAAAVDEPYIKDPRFGAGGQVFDPMWAAGSDAVAGGERVALDGEGNTIVAALANAWPWGNYLVITRYDANGQRMAWSNSTEGHVDDSGEYLYLMPASMSEGPYITAVRDVQADYSSIQVLVDARMDMSASNTDSMIVTFSRSGAYKGIVTHKATPDVDDVGTALIPWGSDIFVVSSAGTQMDVARYSMNYSGGLPVLNTAWGDAGRVSQTLMKCKRQVGGVMIPSACSLHGQRAFIKGTDIVMAGEFDNDAGRTDLFVMAFSVNPPATGANLPGYPITWDLDGVDDNLRGLVFRHKFHPPQHPQNELYVLDAFQRPCGRGFVVARFNADTGAFIDRSDISGGGTNTDPNVCNSTGWLMANDMTVAQNYASTNRYLAVVGGHLSGEPYTGMNAFLALVDTQNMQSSVQVQDFTGNGGLYPADTTLNAVRGNVEDGSYTATGTHWNYDHDQSSAVTLRLLPDRIFRHGFEKNVVD